MQACWPPASGVCGQPEGGGPLSRPLPGLRAKSDGADALVLAHLSDRPDRHRRIPADSELAAAVAVLARAHQDAVRSGAGGPAAPLPAAGVLPGRVGGVQGPEHRDRGDVVVGRPDPGLAVGLTYDESCMLARSCGRWGITRGSDRAAPAAPTAAAAAGLVEEAMGPAVPRWSSACGSQPPCEVGGRAGRHWTSTPTRRSCAACPGSVCWPGGCSASSATWRRSRGEHQRVQTAVLVGSAICRHNPVRERCSGFADRDPVPVGEQVTASGWPARTWRAAWRPRRSAKRRS